MPRDSTVPPLVIRRPEDLGSLIRDRRSALGLSQLSLAGRLGVSRTWVNEIERGSPNAQVGLLLRALNELDIELRAGAATLTPPEIPETGLIDIDAIVDRDRTRAAAPRRRKPGGK